MADFTRVAVLPDGRWILIGDSTDTKPSAAPAGSEASEVDTGYRYVFEDSEWVLDERLTAVNVARGAHIDHANGVAVVEQGQFSYETVAASQTDQALGGAGGVGDFLHKLVIVVATAATAATSIKDGAGSAISIMPNSPGGGVGVYVVELNIVSTAGAWSVTTGAGVSVIGIGRFTA